MHLEIEPLGDASDDYWNEITQEFLNDLSIDMTVDEVAVRKKRSEEDGLGKKFIYIRGPNISIVLCRVYSWMDCMEI